MVWVCVFLDILYIYFGIIYITQSLNIIKMETIFIPVNSLVYILLHITDFNNANVRYTQKVKL